MVKIVSVDFEDRELFYDRGEGSVVVRYYSDGQPGNVQRAIREACAKLCKNDPKGPSIRPQTDSIPITRKVNTPNGDLNETSFDAEICNKDGEK